MGVPSKVIHCDFMHAVIPCMHAERCYADVCTYPAAQMRAAIIRVMVVTHTTMAISGAESTLPSAESRKRK